MVQLVADGLGPMSAGDRLVDAYAGVGLFGATLADRTPGLRVTAVESARSSVADAKVNLAGAAETGQARVIASTMAKWRPSQADAVVADLFPHTHHTESVAVFSR